MSSKAVVIRILMNVRILPEIEEGGLIRNNGTRNAIFIVRMIPRRAR